jgi:hypothetical protein
VVGDLAGGARPVTDQLQDRAPARLRQGTQRDVGLHGCIVDGWLNSVK